MVTAVEVEGLQRLALDVVHHPLTTVIGQSGAGKTRRAAAVAAQLGTAFADGVWWLDLSWAPESAVAERLATTIGAPTTPRSPAETVLVAHLRSRRSLLVIDGCDRVRRTCARLAGLLREACPEVRLLATSRTPLGAAEEVVRTATATERDATPDAHTRGQLTPAADAVLARLAVFRGSFTPDAAALVAGDQVRPALVSAAIAELIAAGSLMVDERTHEPDEIALRYRMPDPVRQYAAPRLGDVQESLARQRHANCFFRIATAAEQGLDGRDQARWLRRLTDDRDNLVAAIEWLIDNGHLERALSMAGSLGRFWWLSGSFEEGSRLLGTVLTVPGAYRRTAGRASALHALGLQTFWHETRPEQARRSEDCYRAAVQIYRELGEQHQLARAVRNLGSQLNGTGDTTRARLLLTESVEIARRIDDVAAMGVGACYLGILASYTGDRVEARARLEEALVLLAGRGGDDELVRAQFFLACLECDDRNLVAARARFAALVGGSAFIPTLPYVAGFALDGLARLSAAEERLADALRLSGTAAAAHERLGTRSGAAYAAYVGGGLAAAHDAFTHQVTAAYVEEGRRWTLQQAVERGLASRPRAGEHLRPREIDVLRLVDAGLGDHDIARQLFLSPRTVSNHLAAAYRRLGVHSRTAAVRQARIAGLL